ncbi:MAG: DNA mismatch endonuclease Vsr [Nitrospira sp.]|nr:DNA mismatch endonuclease Vsr [Nitrospira sp.]
MDNLSSAQRKRSMQRNTSSNTSPERIMIKLLRASRLKFRAQWKNLPGIPDFVLLEKHVAIFVHGCFWHSHACKPLRLPHTNREYWAQKLKKNVTRHRKIRRLVNQAGWRPLTVWECELKTLSTKRLL